jgi:hypothetical protein
MCEGDGEQRRQGRQGRWGDGEESEEEKGKFLTTAFCLLNS